MPSVVYVFFDIDGVLNAIGEPSHGKIEKAFIKRLNEFCRGGWHHHIHIVFNTAWNERPTEAICADLVAHGFQYPHMVFGQTDSCGGGGDPIRRWLKTHDAVGSKYVIFDDSTRNYGEMWGRLVWIKGGQGLRQKDVNKALDILWRDIEEARERERTVTHLVERVTWLAAETPWLSRQDREKAIYETLDLIGHILTMENFLEAAYLKAPETPNGQ